LRLLSTEHHHADAIDSGPGVWHERLKIHSYDVDFRKRATAEAICRSFLEAAWNHAEQLGFGYGELAKQNKLWVLARLLVQIDLYPCWGETVELTTWPRGTTSVFALRDFEIRNAAARTLVAGTSSWLVLNDANHRPQRIDKLLFRIPNPEIRPALGREPKKLRNLETASTAFTAAVRYSDIDVNCHLNSARYVGWLLDAYPTNFHESHALRALEVNYVGESRWTDTLSILSYQRGPMEFAHSIVKPDQSEVCRAEFSWIAEPPSQPFSTLEPHP
jgi:medium-chain acyl-[acyl-carrier-protein] hydrolase